MQKENESKFVFFREPDFVAAVRREAVLFAPLCFFIGVFLPCRETPCLVEPARQSNT